MKDRNGFTFLIILSARCCIQIAFGLCIRLNQIEVSGFLSSYTTYELRCDNFQDIWFTDNNVIKYHGLIINTVNTTNPRIEYFPQSAEKLNTLKIEHTELKELAPNSLKNIHSLKEAFLSHNRITKIESNVFSGMQSLETLDLSYNDIKTIDVRAFSGVNNLKFLYLNNNNISQLAYFVFVELESLISLDVSTNPIKHHSVLPIINSRIESDEYEEGYDATHDEQYFLQYWNGIQETSQRVLKKLKTVNMTNTNLDSTNYGYVLPKCGMNLSEMSLGENRITRINVMVFSGLYVLEKLNLSYNMIDSMDDGSFANMHKLTTLLLNDNNIQHLTKFIFGPLKSLIYLNLSNNPIAHINEYFLGRILRLNVIEMSNVTLAQNNTQFLKHVNCNTLNVSHNNIENINETMFRNSIRLATLDLSFNIITNLDDSAFSGISNLENINLRNNRISRIQRNLFGDEIKLHFVDFSNNPIMDFASSVIGNWENLREIHLDSLKMQNFSIESVSKMKKKIEKISVSENFLEEVDSTTFSNCTSLLYLDISHNSLTSINESALLYNFKLLRLNAQNNRLRSISSVLFRDTTSLEYLDLSNNEIQNIPAGTFDSFGNLTTLNLSFNHLQYLNHFNTYPLRSLEKLYLQNNKLINIEGANDLQNLQVIFLTNNPWTCENLFNILRNLNNVRVENILVDHDPKILGQHHIYHISCGHEEIAIDTTESSKVNRTGPVLKNYKTQVNNLLNEMNLIKNTLEELKDKECSEN